MVRPASTLHAAAQPLLSHDFVRPMSSSCLVHGTRQLLAVEGPGGGCLLALPLSRMLQLHAPQFDAFVWSHVKTVEPANQCCSG